MSDGVSNSQIKIDIDNNKIVKEILAEGIAFHLANKLEKAVECYKKVVAIQSNHVEALFNMGAALHALGELDEALSFYEKVSLLQSNNANVYNNIGLLLQQLGNFTKASDNYNKAIIINPNYVEAYNNFGNLLKLQGMLDDAILCFQKAILIKPDYADAYSNLGNTLKEQGKLGSAVESYQKAIILKPDLSQAYFNLANTLQEQGDLNKAEENYKKAISLKPDFFNAYSNLGITLQEQGKYNVAISCYNKAIAINPNFATAYNNIGMALQKQNNLDEAVDYFKKAIAISPDYIEGYINLADNQKGLGKFAQAISSYKKAIAIKPSTWLEIMILLTQPQVHLSKNEINNFRQSLKNGMDSLITTPPSDEVAYEKMGVTNFLTAYHGLNDCSLQKQLYELYLHSFPVLNWSSPYVNIKGKAGKKLNVGVLSTNLYNHTIGALNIGIFKNLNRDRFNLIIFRTPHIQDDVSRAIDKLADRVVPISKNLIMARNVISEEKLDLLYYPDIGMCNFTYFMAFFRLATVQCVTWGHPVTTGIKNIDYFISSEVLEISDAKEHYTEQLYLFKGLPCYYYRPKLLENSSTREDYNLPSHGNIYLCPQSLFKIHPDFDIAIMDILAKDPSGWVVFIGGNNKYSKQLLLKRWENLANNRSEQILFLPRLDEDKFLDLFRLADVVLDPFHFSGGKTTSEALSVAAPVVTLPGLYMRSRVTAGCYQHMDMLDLIAKNSSEYVSFANRLATDRQWRNAIVDKIKANSHRIFEDMESVKEFENFIEVVIEKSGKYS
ncbi:MAG: tetratricopeptide repeat protein [Magnetococcales bacterium]|nr:tetratricopeptide repeat protein [Magnetococcales bacterium]